MNMRAIEAHLTRAIGLEPASLGETVLARAVGRRRAARGLGDDASYARELGKSPEELTALIEEVVVAESWFYRHPQAFSVLAAHATSTVAERPTGPYRVASIPCASGEEPYSIAICLLGASVPAERLTIDAVDISASALNRARAGCYTERAVRAVPPALRDQFFSQTGSRFEVARRVRGPVAFHQGNFADPFFNDLQGPYDAIFCRNLLIYLTPEARSIVLRKLDELLGPRGLLFLGHAERLEAIEQHFKRVNHDGAFGYARSDATPAREVSRPTPLRAQTTSKHVVPHSAGKAATSPRGKPPAPLPPATPLKEAQQAADAGDYARAVALCQRSITHQGPSAPAYHLLGMTLQALDRTAESRAALERAIYLDPSCEASLLALGLISRRAGDLAAAERYERRARRASKKTTT